MNELISVIVPAYNVKPYLEKCVKSIIAQTYPNIEIIIVDDGSSDGTTGLCDELQSKFQTVRAIHQKNSGVTKARLTGIENASGQWIGFVDGDDAITPDMYEVLYRNAIENDADISHCGHQTLVNDGERIHYFYNTGKKKVYNREEGLLELINGEQFEPGLWSKLFRKSLFKQMLQNEMMDSSIRINEDLLMNFYLFQQAKKSVYEDICLYLYMSRPSSVTRTGSGLYRVTDPVKVRKTIMDHAHGVCLEAAKRKYLIACRNAYYAALNNKGQRQVALGMRQEVFKYKSEWAKLPKIERYKLYGMLYFPRIYRLMLAIHYKYFKVIEYE